VTRAPAPSRLRPLALALAALLLVAPDAEAQLRAGTRAPEVDLPTLGGQRFRLSALRGRPVVMTFWGTWCPPCRDEFPELATAFRDYHALGLEVVAVNQRDQELSTAAVEEFVAEFASPFIVVLDTRGRSRRAYRLRGLPTTLFIDTAGVVTRVVSGPITPAQLAAGLATIGIPAR
jgi:cytochrome c biogenesis protein CcmG, thiol:disulfide interchange protein DsbE